MGADAPLARQPTFAKRVERLELDLPVLLDPAWPMTKTIYDLLACIREQQAALVDANEHLSELREAWQRGCISEHDGHGGRRSNRNVDVQVKVSAILARYALPEANGGA